MADMPCELRAKCSEALHKEFHIFAMACGREGSEILRELAAEFVARERHAHMLRCRLLQSEGIEVDAGGSRGGATA